MTVTVGMVGPARVPHATARGSRTPGPRTMTTVAGGLVPVPLTRTGALAAEHCAFVYTATGLRDIENFITPIYAHLYNIPFFCDVAT